MFLLLAHKDINRCAREVPTLANLVLEIATIGFLNPLWEVAEKGKRWHVWSRNYDLWVLLVGGGSGGLELGDILDLDELTLVVRWWISTDNLLTSSLSLAIL